VGELKENCYILSDSGTSAALVIDPGAEPDRITRMLREHGLKLAGILVTHAHSDHLGAVEPLWKSTGAPVWIHEADANAARGLCPKVKFKTLKQDGVLRMPPFEVVIIHVPGHTPGSICVKWKNRLFSGDTLFFESVGKAEKMDSFATAIREKLWALDDTTTVYPGHGPTTSIAHERQYNPYLRDEFPAPTSSIQWVEDYSAALARAKREKAPLLLFLTVKQWPCAQGYTDQVFQDLAVSTLLARTVNCRIDLQTQPSFAERFGLSITPAKIPAVVFLDDAATSLDLLEKPSAQTLAAAGRSILGGSRPLERLRTLEQKPGKTAGDYMEMGQYLKDRMQMEKAIFYFETARSVSSKNTPAAIRAERALLDAYAETDACGDAIETADALLSRSSGLTQDELAQILFRKCTLLYKKKDYAGCRALLGEFMKKHGAQYSIHQALLLTGLCYLAEGDYKMADDALCKAGNGAPEDVQAKALYLRGYCHLIQQEYGAARDLFVKLGEEHPDSEWARKAASYVEKLAGQK
jgi:glyoxylase-like metal-dependent hydrolase (beta-lactamase superfamily II)/TolA-binding protein